MKSANRRSRTGFGGKPPFQVLLAFLTLLFALRIAGQYGSAHFGVAFLPAFDIWHSATMSYGALLSAQSVILIAMICATLIVPFQKKRPRVGRILLLLGCIYAATMTIRLVVGALELSAARWFDGATPTAFHFLLAAFIVALGASFGGTAPAIVRAIVRFVAYPALLVGGFMLFIWLRRTEAPLLFSSYLSVLVATVGILLHETLLPAREDWRPRLNEVVQDGLFVALVQVALPALLKVAALALIVGISKDATAPFHDAWPHKAPLLAQILLMLALAEFFRYWIHRILHVVDPLWRLHAVHHASDKLYTINVGRFHPFDKALQFLGDTAPFLLLGVSPEVFAAYFVIYAVHGFYQHSNADLRLGPLNWIIAGPELHRWHHSGVLGEARSNYGNNLIVWDIVFATRYLPSERKVDHLGIGNPGWPNGFFAQLIAPFTIPTDRPGQ